MIVSDYNYGILTARVIQTLADLQALSPRVLVVDSRNLNAYRYVGVTAVKPNYTEAIQLLDIAKVDERDRVAQITAQHDRLLEITGLKL